MIKIEDFPKMIIFDILNICNLHCLHCPQKEIVKKPGFKPVFLDFELFRKIIDEVSAYEVDLIRFTGDGEPLLHKRLLEMVTYAKAKVKGKINLTTNGLLLTEEINAKLLKIPVDFIDISIDAFSEEKYNLIRNGGNFKQLMKNVHGLIGLRDKYKSPTKIMTNMINQELVKDEIDDFKKYWEPLVDFVLVRNLHTVNNYLKNDGKTADDPQRYPCPHLYKRVTIDFSGNLKFCAHDWHDESILGNLNKETIKEIWHGPKYSALRQYHENKEFSRVAFCRNCLDWQSVPWNYGYDKVIKQLTKNEGKE